MLPFSNSHWAKGLAAVEIAIVLIAAVGLSILLHQRGVLDPPMVLAMVLLLLAVLPNRVALLLHASHHPASDTQTRHATR